MKPNRMCESTCSRLHLVPLLPLFQVCLVSLQFLSILWSLKQGALLGPEILPKKNKREGRRKKKQTVGDESELLTPWWIVIESSPSSIFDFSH